MAKANRDKKLNYTKSGNVEYWQTYNDPNHNDRHALCAGVEFFAFPSMSSLYARVGDKSATVGTDFDIENGKVVNKWYAGIRECLPNGNDKPIARQVFADRDAAFEWAAEKLTNG